MHGDRRADDYFWLRGKDDPEVMAYLRAENAHTEAVMKPSAALVDTLYAEMLARIKEDDQTVPYRRGDYFYYSRTEQGKQYPILCRKLGSVDAPEEVTLDLNALAAGHPFFALGMAVVSDDGHLLAYTTDLTGFRQYTLSVKDLRTGALLPDHIEKVVSIAWAADDRTLFYVTEDAAKRPYRLYRHVLGAAAGRSRLRGDGRAVQPGRRAHAEPPLSARHRRELHDHRGALSRRRRARVRRGRSILAREQDHEYHVEHWMGEGADERFYIRTNGGGRRNFRLVTAPVADPRPSSWIERIAHRDDVMLEDVEVFATHYVAHERDDGLSRLRVTTLADGGRASHRVPGARVRGVARPQPGVLGILVPVSLPVARHAALGVRLRRGGPPLGPAQADGGARRLRSVALPRRARARDGRRRRPHPHLPRPPRRHAARRHEPAPARRLRRLRHLAARDVLLCALEPARPRRRLRHRAYPGRR